MAEVRRRKVQRGGGGRQRPPARAGGEQPSAEPVATDAPEVGESQAGASGDRLERLRDAVTSLRTRAGTIDVERTLMTLGAILLPLGIAAILLGWAGAANTPYTFEQVPYLISGGMLGMALAVVGGFLYFGYWVARLMREQRTQADRVADALTRIEALLGGDAASGNGSAAPSLRTVAAAEGGAASGRGGGSRRAAFVATPTGSMFHVPACPVVAERSELKRVTGREKGYEPCAICDPLAAA